MKKITRITTQKKRKNRFNIFLDDGQGEAYGFSVDEAVLIEYKLRKGLELDDSMIRTLVQKDNLHKSYTLAINFLSYRMRTIKEINDYLVKKEVEPEHITKIIERLINEKLLDDKMFANAFVQTRIHTTSKGPMLVKKELIDKGVSATIASDAIQQYTYEIQYEKAQKWVSKKLNSNNKHSFRKQIQQLQVTLVQKGFAKDVIKEVVADVQDVKDDDVEWEALVHQGEKILRKHQTKFEGYALHLKIKEALFRKGFTIELINKFLDEKL
ncbi:recombination regulator RecX [Virgibacillus ndiopensis]|uniref:recombination regulator RecX n=1 Tax=Virgibacillus ndiopensis TaxID=2004408 RepID=UPI000C074BCC|nr:recombination regulator RecX [Virgibacillus ndiopensis]